MLIFVLIFLIRIKEIMNMKRVVPFLDIYDGVPNNSKYLFSRKAEVKVEEESAAIFGECFALSLPVNGVVEVYVHYYEVSDMDFEELMNSDYPEKNYLTKIKEFITEYDS